MKKNINNFDKLILIYLYIQPLLDIIAGVLIHYEITNFISSAIRFLFMSVCILYLILNKKDNKILYYLGLLLGYFILFTLTILLKKDVNVLSYELKNLITGYYFVITLLTLIKVYDKKMFNIKHLSLIYLVYALLVFIPNVLGLGFNSYSESKIGSTGWFYSANSIGTVISLLLPFAIIYFNKLKLPFKILTIITGLYTTVSIGTKVPVLSLVIIALVNCIFLIYALIKNKYYKTLCLSITIIIIGIVTTFNVIPKTHFYENILIHLNYLKIHSISDAFHNDRFIDHFIFSERLTLRKKTSESYKNASLMEKTFGIGYIENYATDNVRFKTIEMDYFDIFYRHGIIGFILYFLPVFYIIKKIILYFKKMSFIKLNILISTALIFILALFQGHVFLSPTASIFAALILSLTYNNAWYKK